MTGSLPPAVVQPLEFAVSPQSRRYAPSATEPVTCVEVGVSGARVGWAWWSDSTRAAGWVSDRTAAAGASSTARAWTLHLQSLAEAGAAPSTALEAPLPAGLGEALSDGATTVSLRDLALRAGRPMPDYPSAMELAVEALSGNPVSGATLDAGLRGQVPMSDAMHSQVKSLDVALLNKPVPERMVATRATSLAAWPGEPEALIGQLLLERAYFPVRLGPIEPVEHDAVVHLAIPAGIPAIYTAPPGQPDQGYLILARGLTWQVVDAAQAESGTWVLSADVLGHGSPSPS